MISKDTDARDVYTKKSYLLFFKISICDPKRTARIT